MKNDAIKIIDGMADVFEIVGSGFDKFCKDAKEKSSGYYSTAASSGDSSTAASSGNSSTAASSGDSSTAASSGDSSTAASSGNYSTAASSGNSSTAASSGYSSKAASSGNSSKAASSGNSSTAASSGNYSKAASSGNYSTAASSGNYSTAASSGNYSTAASSGNSSTAASSGNYSTAASSGNSSTAASSGYYSTAASSGNSSKAASSGYYSTAASSGDSSGCAAIGYRAAVKGDLGNLLMASEYIIKDNELVPVGGKADLVDGKKLKPSRWYIVESGEWVEVDLSDNIFGRVLSNRSGVKKIKIDDGHILYVVSDESGNTAHGKTIKEARADLIYKNVAKFEGEIPKSATGAEWVGIYRAVTGACSAGVKMFVESKNIDLTKSYKAKAVSKLVVGQYGADKFSEKVLGKKDGE